MVILISCLVPVSLHHDSFKNRDSRTRAPPAAPSVGLLETLGFAKLTSAIPGNDMCRAMLFRNGDLADFIESLGCFARRHHNISGVSGADRFYRYNPQGLPVWRWCGNELFAFCLACS